ncbi:MAG: CHAT domain-containing tetratricopeptide repeat protein [Burkholderiaceae bacterium]
MAPSTGTPAAFTDALAARLLAGELPSLADVAPAAATAVAWVLKDACYAAWHSEPRQAAAAAAALGRWAAACRATWSGADGSGEIQALADWTDGIAELTRGRMAEAAAALDAADAGFRALGRPGVAAQTQVPRIMALAMLGQHDAAVACAERAQHDLLASGDLRAAGKVSLNLGSLHLRHDDYAQAERHYREAARLLARAGEREHSVMADIGAADALTALGELDEAERVYERARVRAASHALPVLQAHVDESVALLAFSRGRYGEALARFERARAGYEALAMPQHLAIAEKQLGDAYLELRLWPEAERLYTEALARFDALSMPDDTAWTQVQRGRALAWRGGTAAAVAAFDAAGRLFEAQGNEAGRAAVALARAELATLAGQAADALVQAGQAISAYEAAGSFDGALRARLAQAAALARAGRPVDAREAFAAVLQQARSQGRLAAEVRSLTGLAQAQQALGEHAAAREGFEAAVAGFEALRQALPGDDVRSAFLADHLAPFRALLGYALDDLSALPDQAGAAAAVLQAADRLQSRTLSERLAGRGSPVTPSAATPEDTAIDALRARVSWLARRVQGLEDDEGASSAALAGELHRCEQELLERTRRRLLRHGGQAAGTAPGTADEAALAAEMGRHLQANEALLQYVVHGDELLACVLRPDGLAVQRHLAAWPEVLQAVEAAQFQLGALGHGAAPMQAHLAMLTARCNARLQRLHALLWAPLAAPLRGVGRVLLVAPAPLGSLPFAAFSDGQAPLADLVELVWAPSARSAAQGLAARAARVGRLAGATGPAGAHDASAPALVLGESSRLPHAAEEAREVAACHAGAQLLLDDEATVAAWRGRAGAAELLHLACHAQFRGDSPAFSSLVLRDGALTAEQVETLMLCARVVVLSGCQTGGDATGGSPDAEPGLRGDEWVGLVRAFLLAGAGQVVASLWRVDDEVTRAFMRAFHGALAGGAAVGPALRQARQAVRATHPHPFHWASFTLYGVA